MIRKTSKLRVLVKIAEYVSDSDIVPEHQVKNLPSYLIGVFSMIRPFTKHVYLVGGAVRDLILGKDPKDFDIVTDVEPELLEPLFLENGWAVKEAGTDFKVLHVSKGGVELEIARFRKDLHAESNQTEVAAGDIYDDALRRDLTVNALYLDPFSGKVYDPSGEALDTIKSDRKVKFMGDADQRIDEDYTRILRFMRFIDKLRAVGFEPDEASLEAVKRNFHKVKKLDHNRVREELEKMIGLKQLEKKWTSLKDPQRYPQTVRVEGAHFKKDPAKVFKFLGVLKVLAQHGFLPSTGSISTFRNILNKVQKELPEDQYYAAMAQLASVTPDMPALELERTIEALNVELESILQDPRTAEREKRLSDIYKKQQDAIQSYLD